jgi:hypothetical protein
VETPEARNLSWGGTPTFDVYFWADNTVGVFWYAIGTSTTSKSNLQYAFYPCRTTTFTQELDVYDQHGAAYTTSQATEAGGNPC